MPWRREARITALVAALLLAPLSGTGGLDALATDQPPSQLPAETTLSVVSGDRIELGPSTDGWGRIVLQAEEEVKLTVSIRHDTMEDLSTFTDDGDAFYDARHYTFVYLLPIGEAPDYCGEDSRETYYFEWWGIPNASTWPNVANEEDLCGGSTRFDLAAGERRALVVANNVPGYTLALTATSPSSGNEPANASVYTWELGSAPSFHAGVLQPDVNAVVDHAMARVDKTRHWHTQTPVTEDSIVKVSRWFWHNRTTLRAGLSSSEADLYDADEGPSEQGPRSRLPGPSRAVMTEPVPGEVLLEPRDVGPARTPPVFVGITPRWSQGVATTSWQSPATPLVYDWQLERTDVGPANESVGTALATIPYESVDS